MLELISISRAFSLKGSQEPVPVLEQVSFGVPAGHLMAIIGPTGSGKTMLLEILAGIQTAGGGTVLINGKDTTKHPLHPNLIGYVPASDDVLNEELTVRESLTSALMLRVAEQTPEQRVDKVSHLLVGLGLETIASQPVKLLSLAQRRRLKLGLALVADPLLVLCDEFTDGMDVKSERELAALLKFITTDRPGRVVIHATQSIGNLTGYDTTIVLHEGNVCFHGPGRAITHYFSIPAVEELYSRLARRPAQRWGESWLRHRDSYYNAFKLGSSGDALGSASDEDDGADSQRITLPKPEPEAPPPAEAPIAAPPRLPSALSQAQHLTLRRWTTLRRTRREWLSHLILLAAAPIIMALLVLPNRTYLNGLSASTGAAPEVLWPAAYTCAMALLVQVLFILVLGVRNGAREITRERGLFDRERAGGLRVGAYLMSKAAFIVPLALVQSFLLGALAELATGGLPGNAAVRLMLLMLTGIAFSLLCLAISAHCRTAERAHSRAWMLAVGNLVFSGALLGFPRVLGGIIQPFVTAYYGWSGSVDTLHGTPVFEPISHFVRTWFATPGLATGALCGHAVLGLFLTFLGLRQRRAE